MGAMPMLMGSGPAPTVTPGTGAGDNPTIQMLAGSDNVSGTIRLVQGSGGVANGKIMTLTLADGLTFPNKPIIVFSAKNANFAGLMEELYTLSPNDHTLELWFNGLALGFGLEFIGDYVISGR